jgi:FAD/FMN-containing dehydrogenase
MPEATRETWTNWVGNQSFAPRAMARPTSEEEVADLVRASARQGTGVRVAAAGHSFTPIVQTKGLLLELAALRGVLSVERRGRRAVALAGTSIRDFGEPLWEAGLALANQGDIDTQHIAGAVATGTHGSGIGLPSFSGSVTSVRLVDGTGAVVDVGRDQLELLRAAKVAVGLLGVMTRIELEVVEAYRLRERIQHRPYADVMDRWHELVAAHRHFSFFWLPSEESAALYGLETPQGVRLADTCYVKAYDEAAPDEPDSSAPGRRVDRGYRIYPSEFEPNFHELEYFVPFERGADAIAAMREMMLASLPDSIFPMEVRTTAADDAYLSPAYRTPTAVISVSGAPGTYYWDYLKAVDATLAPFDARVHWGKLHFLTREQLDARYPEAETFRRLRRQLDPQGVFLNDHLRALFE